VIVGSIVLVGTAAVLLVLGLTRSNDTLFYSSIVASVVAALALLVGVRQFPAGRLPEADFDIRPGGPGPGGPPVRPTGRAEVPRPAESGEVVAAPDVSTGTASATLVEDAQDLAAYDLARFELADQVVPEDEPAVQAVTDADAAAVGRLGTPVIVVDGRPRYHVADCLHVLGRSIQRVPVREAAVIGFTPCALCEPVTRLLRA
jgi:hypothetical protein